MKTENFQPERFIALVLLLIVSGAIVLGVLGGLVHVVIMLVVYGWHSVDFLFR